MKRIALAIAALGSLSVATLPLSPAQAEPKEISGGEIKDFCANVVILFPSLSNGDCIALNHTLVNEEANGSAWGQVSQFCDVLWKTQPDVFYANFDTHSDCVRTVKADNR